jgi:hypothetical protein
MSFVADPTGGFVNVEAIVQPAGDRSYVWRRFDDHGTTAAGPLPLPDFDAPRDSTGAWAHAAVSMTGHTLVVYGTFLPGTPVGFACQAVWLDRKGLLLAPAFHPDTCVVQRLLPLADGGIVQSTSVYPAYEEILVGTWPDGSGVLRPVPDLLADWDKYLFELPPSGAGNVVGNRSGGLSVFAASGKKCGEVRAGNGQWSAIGADGTAVTLACVPDCTVRWYPRLFRKMYPPGARVTLGGN